MAVKTKADYVTPTRWGTSEIISMIASLSKSCKLIKSCKLCQPAGWQAGNWWSG